MIEKVMSINTLQTLKLYLKVIDFSDISNIKGKNTSLKKLYIEWHNEKDCLLKNIHIKFPNLSYIDLMGEGFRLPDDPIILRIKEDFNCKINDINYGFINENTEIYCQTFENLEKLKIGLVFEFIIEFPIFTDDCNTIFKSLTHFSLVNLIFLPSSIINNLFDNLDKMPNLIYFDIFCVSSEINEDSYIKIIKNIVQHKKLDYIKIKILTEEFIDEFDSFEEDKNSYITIFNPRIGIYIKKINY